MLLPTWSIIHSRLWKAQVAYLARHYRVVTFDGRGTGRSDRPRGPAAYTHDEFAADTLAVLDATGTERAVLVAPLVRRAVGASSSPPTTPSGSLGLVAIGAGGAAAPRTRDRGRHPFDEPLDDDRGLGQVQPPLLGARLRRTSSSSSSPRCSPSRTRPSRSRTASAGVGDRRRRRWSTPHAGHAGVPAGRASDASVPQVRCPVLVIHGDEDRIRPHADGRRPRRGRPAARSSRSTAAATAPTLRDPSRQPPDRGLRRPGPPEPPHARRTWVRAPRRPKRALYLSSPIGLGHARRDVAIAAELRQLPPRPADRLARPAPGHRGARGRAASGSTRRRRGWPTSRPTSRTRPASTTSTRSRRSGGWTRSSSTTSWCSTTSSTDEHYDLVIGDEAWDVDYFLHENPELKRFAFAWMTDFVGWLPMPDGGDARGRADRRLQRRDDRAAGPVPAPARPLDLRRRPRRHRARLVRRRTCPAIREWTEANFEFAGYVTGFDPAEFADREALRAELGYRPDERVCIVTVGGSGVGGDLLRRVVDAVPAARRLVDDAARSSSSSARASTRARCPRRKGVSYRRYVPDLYRHLAACDLAVVQGGLTTCMELTANRRPFVYVPLRHHFEQNFHVHHRLQRYGAGRRLDYDEAADPDGLAKVIADEIGRDGRLPARSTPAAPRGPRRRSPSWCSARCARGARRQRVRRARRRARRTGSASATASRRSCSFGADPIVDAQMWKSQIPWFARRHTVRGVRPTRQWPQRSTDVPGRV